MVTRWSVGKPEQHTETGVTRVTCPLMYRPGGLKERRVGSVDADYAGALRDALRAPEP